MIERAERQSPAEASASLDALVWQAFASGHGRELLAALRRQARALDGVWEAYRRGAAQLPDSVAMGVEQALATMPVLVGGTARE